MDRLADLGGAPAPMDTAIPIGGEPEAPAPEALPLDLCVKVCGEIQTCTNEIRDRTGKLRDLMLEAARTFSPDGKEDDEKGRALTEEADALQKLGKRKLDELKQAIGYFSKTEESKNANAATIKIYENQYAHLSRQFMQVLTDYKGVHNEQKKMLKEQTIRRIKVKFADDKGRATITDEEAEKRAMEILDFGQPDAMFQQAKDTLNHIMETRRDYIRIEQSMRDLQAIFNDLNVLVNEQGAVMEQISTNVQTSIKYVEQGREQLKGAKKEQKKGRKKMCIIIIIVFIVFLFILAGVLGVSVPTTKK